MDVFTLLNIEGAKTGKIKPKVSSGAVEIIRGCRLTLEWGRCLRDLLHHKANSNWKNSYVLQ